MISLTVPQEELPVLCIACDPVCSPVPLELQPPRAHVIFLCLLL